MKHTLTKSTNRILLLLKHYKFKQRLIEKAKSMHNFRVYIVGEEYTSKTCGNCGTINENLGSNKIFSCESCKVKVDRDINGARNILLKHLL